MKSIPHIIWNNPTHYFSHSISPSVLIQIKGVLGFWGSNVDCIIVLGPSKVTFLAYQTCLSCVILIQGVSSPSLHCLTR